jgi:hypothetical protein
MVPDFMDSWLFMGAMLVLAIALIGVFFYIRNKRSDED